MSLRSRQQRPCLHALEMSHALAINPRLLPFLGSCQGATPVEILQGPHKLTSESPLARIARESERKRELHEDVCVHVYENVGLHVSNWNKHRILHEVVRDRRAFSLPS